MKEYVVAIASVIAGIFAMISAVIAWRLKNSSDERAQNISLKKEHRDEIKQFYANTFVLFEQAMLQVSKREEFSLAREFSETNAKMHLLAPEKVAEQYLKVAILLEDWSRLHTKASPRQLDLNGQTITLIQSPDPTAKFKDLAKIAHEALQAELQIFTKLMRMELAANA